MTTRTGRLMLAALGVAALTLMVIEFALGATSFGQPRLADPCTATAGPSGGGLGGTVQRLTRETLDGAACQHVAGGADRLTDVSWRSKYLAGVVQPAKMALYR